IAAKFKSDAAIRQTLAWLLGGMVEEEPLAGRPSVDALVADLVAKDIPEETARQMAELAAKQAPEKVNTEDPLEGVVLGATERQEAEGAALRLAYATAGGRRRIRDLDAGGVPELQARYGQLYPEAVCRAKLADVELLDDFPVLNAVYGYTRGGDSPDSILQPFPSSGGSIRIH